MMIGIFGIRLTSNPAITRKIGYEILSFELSMQSIDVANNNNRTTSKLFSMFAVSCDTNIQE